MKKSFESEILKTTLKEDDWLIRVCVNLKINGILQDDESDTIEWILRTLMVDEELIQLTQYNSLIELLHNRNITCPLKSMTKITMNRFYYGPGSGSFYPMDWNRMTLEQKAKAKSKRMKKRIKSFDKYMDLYSNIPPKPFKRKPKFTLLKGGKDED